MTSANQSSSDGSSGVRYTQPLRSRMTLETLVSQYAESEPSSSDGRFVKSMNEADPVNGRIFLVDALPLSSKKIPGNFKIRPTMWHRCFNIFFWYADPAKNKEDFLIPESFSALYGTLFNSSFALQDFGESNLQRIFQHFTEWINIDLDPAGFMRMTLRSAPAQHPRGMSTMSSTYGSKSVVMKTHPLTFYLNEEEEIDDEIWMDEMGKTFPLSHQDRKVNVPSQILKDNLRFLMYYLILRHFPKGIDTREIVKAWHEKWGNSLCFQQYEKCKSLEILLEKYMDDLVVYKRKSPTHGIVFVRLDIPAIKFPKKLLQKVGLWDDVKLVSEGSFSVSGSSGRVKLPEPIDIRGEAESSGAGGRQTNAWKPQAPPPFYRPYYTPAKRQLEGTESAENLIEEASDEFRQQVENVLSQKSGGITFQQLNSYMLHMKSPFWLELQKLGTTENSRLVKELLEREGQEASFSGRHWWCKKRNEEWCGEYWNEVETATFTVEPPEMSPIKGKRVDSSLWSGSPASNSSHLLEKNAARHFATSTPTRSLVGELSADSNNVDNDGWEVYDDGTATPRSGFEAGDKINGGIGITPDTRWDLVCSSTHTDGQPERRCGIGEAKRMITNGIEGQGGVRVSEVARSFEEQRGFRLTTKIHDWANENRNQQQCRAARSLGRNDNANNCKAQKFQAQKNLRPG